MAMTLKQDPVKEAEQIRSKAWGHMRFPVDPTVIARRLGVDVRQAPLDPNVSGALVKRMGRDPAILLNAKDHPNRQRFTCAHELGHFVSRENAPEAYEYVDLRDTIFSSAETNPEEVFANLFAANLLMPLNELRRLQKEKASPTEMALHFDVSQDAMHFRLESLQRGK